MRARIFGVNIYNFWSRSYSPLLQPVSSEFSAITNKIRELQINCFITPRCYGIETKVAKTVPNSKQAKAKLILQMNFRTSEDAKPFYDMPMPSLLQVHKATLADNQTGFCKNRLYYISDLIKVPPAELSKNLVRRSFIYTISSDWLEKALNTLLEMGVSGNRIRRDLWVLKYHPDTINERLQQCREKGIKTFYPWMVRCTPNILNRYVQILNDTKQILGDGSTTQMYLAQRLRVNPAEVEDMCARLPALRTIRVTKLKSFLDFLIEEGFEEQEIASKIRVLTASQKTVKQRLENLRKIGLNHINLNILCKSRKEFRKYCETIETVLKASK